jgi:hypothetical protein
MVRRMLMLTVLVFGCGGSRTAPKSASPPPSASAEIPAGGDASAPDRVAVEELIGGWQNASCGDRGYLRKYEFHQNGTFTAADEVAPCPEDAECVTSGVIEWQGTWSLGDLGIEITSRPGKSGRLPEQVPESFVVLSMSPLSIGEKTGQLVCPFRRDR